MGCDDMMLPTYLENALAHIGEADYYQPAIRIIDEVDAPYLPITDRIKKLLRPKRQGIHAGETVATSLCRGNWLYFPSILWKLDTLKLYGFSSDYPNTHDLITAIDILQDGGSLYVDNSVTFCYRRSSNSFSSKAKKGTRFNEEDTVSAELAKQFDEMGWHKAARAARLHITIRLNQLLSKLS
jgi:hypothetical protein